MYPYLAEHLKYAPSIPKYTSPDIQNEIISLCEQRIRKHIIDRIKKYFSIMTDETQDSAMPEQFSHSNT